MPEILVTVRDKFAENTLRHMYVCSNSDYQIRFDFDAEWTAHQVKTARFRYGVAYQDVVFTGDTCPMPVIENAAVIYVGVYAGDLRTTTTAIIRSAPSILSGNGAPADPPPDVYAQIMARIDSGVLQGPEGKSAYQVALENGFVGTEVKWLASLQGPPGDTTAAEAAAAAAKQSAEAAQTAAEASAGSAAQAAESVGGLSNDLTALKEENAALKADAARTARSLDYLWKKSKGIVYDTEIVTGAGSSVTVPSGAMDYAALRMVGGMSRRGRNLLNYGAWKSVTTIHGTAYFADYGITITATVEDAFTNYNSGFPEAARIAVAAGDKISLTWETNTDTSGLVFIFPEGKIDGLVCIDNANAKRLDYTVPTGVTYITFRFGVTKAGDTIAYKNIMIQQSAATTDWEPYTDSLLDAPVDGVRVSNAAGSSTGTYPIPQAIRDLCPDYGIGVSADCYNYIDFATKQYHHNVGQVDLGTLKWSYTTSSDASKKRVVAAFAVPSATSPGKAANILCAAYDTISINQSWFLTAVGIAGGEAYLYIYDPAYSDGAAETLAAFTAHIAGAPLYYELATPETIDLSAVWPDDDFGILQVEAGGTIGLHYPALEDGYELAVPSETEIMVDVAKAVETNG